MSLRVSALLLVLGTALAQCPAEDPLCQDAMDETANLLLQREKAFVGKAEKALLENENMTALEQTSNSSMVQAKENQSINGTSNESWGSLFATTAPPSLIDVNCPAPSVLGSALGTADPSCCYGNAAQIATGSLGYTQGPCTNPGKSAGGAGIDCPMFALCTASISFPGFGTPVYGYCKCQGGMACSTDGASCNYR